MSDETPEEGNKDEEALFNALGAEMNNNAMNESWITLNETYQGLISGGFTQAEALALLSNLIWKMMTEGS